MDGFVRSPIVEFDHHTREFARNRTQILLRLRESTPLAYTSSYGGHWIVTSHALVKEVLGHPEIFSSEKLPDGTRGVTIPSVGPRLIPPELDGPEHAKLRRLIMPAYSPKAIKNIESIVKDVVTKIVDELIRKGDFDIVEDIAEILPPLIGLKHLGFPEDQREEMVEAVKIALSTNSPDAAVAKAFGDTCQQMRSFAQLRRASPCGDLMSVLAQSKDPELTDDELMWVGITLFVGGFKNPGAHISSMLLHLGTDLALRQRLIHDRGLIPKANEEFLRFYSSGVAIARTAIQDTVLGGVSVSAGDRMLIVLPGANHDEAVFEDGETFNIDRKNNFDHVAYGNGPHFCVGMRLANLMFGVLLNEILDRIPDYIVYADRAERVSDAGIQAGYVSMPASTGISTVAQSSSH